MGCNAWNHSTDCRCGWGGDGHLGRRTLFSDLIQSAIVFKTYRDLLHGFTNPNAKCPVCGDPVYFYASPNGGRVFFDELGPPWPKHSCTDHGSPVIELPLPSFSQTGNEGDYENDGWTPFLCQDIQKIRSDKSIVKLTGLIKDQKQTFFAIKDGLSEGAPFLVKHEDDGKIWISTVIATKFEIKAENFRVFIFESDLHTLYEASNTKVKIKSKRSDRRQNRQINTSTISTKNELLQTKSNLQKCSHCGARVNNLQKHVERAHINHQLYKCIQCGAEVRDLEKHHNNTHSVEAQIKLEYEKIRREKRKIELRNKKNIAKQVSLFAKKGI